MKYIKNKAASFHCTDDILPSLGRLSEIISRRPSCLEPFRGMNEEVKAIFSEGGFQLYPTVKKTTLLYERESDCFFKILHPLNIKNRVLFHLNNRARSVYNISGRLLSEGVKTASVIAYGRFNKGRSPFFVVRRAEGESLYEILIRGKRTLDRETYFNVIGEVAKIHRLGYRLGDAHLSHIFVKDGRVSGIIDLDSIRRNRFFFLKKLAKDIAGLNHPELPLTEDEKREILYYYLNGAGITKGKRFSRMIKHYTERRWKD
ncbi:MAG: hypothetical protein HZC49_13230 [Nitrospirae bacterium]|nr:hypothetical protein [Nitrospirota bacterium]